MKPSRPRLRAPFTAGAFVRRRPWRAACGGALVVILGLGLWWRGLGPVPRSPRPADALPAAAAAGGLEGPSERQAPRASSRAPLAALAAGPGVGAIAAGLAPAGQAPTGSLPSPFTLTATAAEATTQSLMLTVASYALEPAWGGRWAVTLGEALPLAVEGEPALPFVRHEVLLGGSSEPELEIVSAVWEERACPPLLASPGFVSRAAAPRGAGASGLASRATVGRFPDSPARLTPVYRWRGLRGVGVIFCPFRYDAAAGVLGICRRLEVRVRGAAAATDLAALPGSTLALAAQRWPEQTAPVAKTGGASVPQESLLVLVPEFLVAAPALAEFALWKQQRGVAVSVQAVSVPVGASTISALIRGYAEGKDRANVLLLGDEAAIPPAQMTAPPSDTVYALLDGSADRYHDLSIARLTATSAGDVAIQLGRTVMYERWQWPSPSPGTWCGAATGVASNENQGNLGLLDREAMETARLSLLDFGDSPCDAIYDLPGVTASQDTLAAAWNRGRGLILYLGHGLQQSWRTTGFAVSDVSQRLRYGAALPFVVSAACYTGNFAVSTECLCEALLKGGSASEPTGAVGAIGATSVMDWDPPVVMLQSFTAYLTRRAQFASGGMTFVGGAPRSTAGELTFGAVQRAVDFCLATPIQGDIAARRIVEQTHLFGDPTLGVRTRIPTALRVGHSPTATCGAPFEVTAQEAATGRALAGLTVCLFASGGVQWLGTTDDQGSATFAVPAEAVPEALTVTVYAPDVIPYQGVVRVSALVAPVVVVTAALPVGRRAVPYTTSLVARSGNGRGLRWSTTGELPAGLSLVSDGTLAGTPAGFGSWHLVVRATDDSMPPHAAEAEYELLIESPVYVGLTVLPEAESCGAYRTDIQALGTWPPFSFSVPVATEPGGAGQPAFPDWLALSPSGELVGVAPAPLSVTVPIRVTDALGYESTAELTLTVHDPPADRDGNGDVDGIELLRYAALAHSGCVTASAWTEAVERWEQGSQAAPSVPEGTWLGALPRRIFGSALYLPGGEETLRIELGLTAPTPGGASAILSEVLPPGWLVLEGSGRDAGGRVLPGPRRDGQTISWVLDEAALRSGAVSFGVRPAESALSPAGFDGWIASAAGVAPTGGALLWWPGSASGFSLPLQSGWNLISLPLEVPSGNVPVALGALGLRRCEVRSQPRGAVLTVAALGAYWVYAPTPTRVDLVGVEPALTMPILSPGWNACGVSGAMPVAALLGAPRLAWTWTARGWEPTTDLVPGRGYLVYVREAETGRSD